MHLKAQVVLQGGTMIPEDRFINTWHFDVAGTSLTSAAGVVHAALLAFYKGDTSGSAHLGYYLSDFVAPAVAFRYYNMGQTGQRVPFVVNETIAPGAGAVANVCLPEEVAVVASFHGAPPITPRRRGRIYFGPLNGVACTDASTTAPTRVATNLRALLVTKMQALRTANVGWCVYSPTDNALVPVAGGWVDNAFDTQRRRGPDASTRSTWVAV